MGKGQQMRRVGIGILDSRQGRKGGGDLGNDVGLGLPLNSLRFSLLLLLLLLLSLRFSLSHFLIYEENCCEVRSIENKGMRIFYLRCYQKALPYGGPNNKKSNRGFHNHQGTSYLILHPLTSSLPYISNRAKTG